MMKLQSVIASGAAVLLGLPVALGSQDELSTLRAALASTDNSLTVLQQFAEKLKGGAPLEREAVLRATEPPILDPRARDERLEELRGQVGMLTTQVDEAEARDAPEAFIDAAKDRVVYGFDDDVRRALRSLGLDRPKPVASRRTTPKPVQPVAPTPVAPGTNDAPTYSADPLGQARALFLAKRYERALTVLQPLDTNPKALYWRGRTFEKLARYDEALASLEQARALSTDDLLTRLVETDIEFVAWRKSIGNLGRDPR